MKNCLIAIILVCVAAFPAFGGINNTSGPGGVSCSAFSSFSGCASAAATAGKNLIVDKPMTVSNDLTVTGRALQVVQGGSLVVASGKTLTINGPFEAGLYQIFTGAGSVTGLKKAYPQWWGAVGDGAHNDQPAIQAAVKASRTVHIPAGTYLIDNNGTASANDGIIITNSDTTIQGVGPKSILKQSDTCRHTILIRSSKTYVKDATLTSVRGVTIKDLYFDGPSTRQSPVGHVLLELMMQINAVYVSDLTIKNCTFYAPQGDSIHLAIAQYGEASYSGRHNIGVKIINNLFDGYDHNQGGAILMGDGTNVLIQGNTFKNLSPVGEPGSIDFETDPYPHAILKNIQVINNRFYDTNGSAHIQLYLPAGSTAEVPRDFLFSDNQFYGTGAGISLQIKSDITIGIIIARNHYYGSGKALACGYGSAKEYFNGLIVDSNFFSPINSSDYVVRIGKKDVYEDSVKNLKFSNNILVGNTSAAVMLIGGSVSYADIVGNTFIGGLNFSLNIGDTASKIVSNITVVNNTFTGLTGTTKRAVHYTSADKANWATNTARDNKYE